jgi:hypothetical protein
VYARGLMSSSGWLSRSLYRERLDGLASFVSFSVGMTAAFVSSSEDPS